MSEDFFKNLMLLQEKIQDLFSPLKKSSIKIKPHIKLHQTWPRIEGKRVWLCTGPREGSVRHDSASYSPSKALEAYLRSKEANK